MTREIKRVWIYWGQPRSDDDAGSIREEWYVKEPYQDRWRMTMSDRDGYPLRKTNGELWTHVLRPGDDENKIAKKFLHDVQRELYKESDFTKPIDYPYSSRAKCPV